MLLSRGRQIVMVAWSVVTRLLLMTLHLLETHLVVQLVQIKDPNEELESLAHFEDQDLLLKHLTPGLSSCTKHR